MLYYITPIDLSNFDQTILQRLSTGWSAAEKKRFKKQGLAFKYQDKKIIIIL